MKISGSKQKGPIAELILEAAHRDPAVCKLNGEVILRRIAEKAGVSPTVVSRFLGSSPGAGGGASADNIHKLLKAFDLLKAPRDP